MGDGNFLSLRNCSNDMGLGLGVCLMTGLGLGVTGLGLDGSLGLGLGVGFTGGTGFMISFFCGIFWGGGGAGTSTDCGLAEASSKT